MLAAKHREDFLLDFENNTFCNHGSYGAIPKVKSFHSEGIIINLY